MARRERKGRRKILLPSDSGTHITVAQHTPETLKNVKKRGRDLKVREKVQRFTWA